MNQPTVSRVINGARTVDPALRRAVERAIGITSYVPNRAARSLVTRRAEALSPSPAAAVRQLFNELEP